MKVELIDSMGTDLTVVNAARVSFAKESEWEYSGENDGLYPLKSRNDAVLSAPDQGLIKYLSKHNHWTPFSHVMIQMREKVPIFVARQRFKHMVGFTYNEVSRRYVDDAPEFFTPKEWRGAPENAKQGSSDKVIEEDLLILDHTYEGDFGGVDGYLYGYDEIVKLCEEWYTNAIKNNVAPEQARMILPQSMYTEYYVTGSLAAWARAYKQRIDSHAQLEIQELAGMWGDVIGSMEELEYSWEALTE